MARGRIVNNKISLSEKVADLPIEGQLLYTWMIPHSDDLGLLQYSSKTIKAMVMPMIDIPLATIDGLLTTMVNIKLLDVVKQGTKKYYHICDFDKNQSLRKDRQPSTLLDFTPDKNSKISWKTCNKIVNDNILVSDDNKVLSHDIPMTAEIKLNEIKLNKTKTTKVVRKNSLTNKVSLEKKVGGSLTKEKTYGNEDINYLVDYFKKKLGLPLLDGPQTQNRQYCWLLIKKFGGEDKVKLLIDAASNDGFWKTKITSFQGLYYKAVQIISKTREEGGKDGRPNIAFVNPT